MLWATSLKCHPKLPDYYRGPEYCQGRKYYQGFDYFQGLDYRPTPNDEQEFDWATQLYLDGMCVPSMKAVPGSSIQPKQLRRGTDVLDAVAEAIRATRPELRPLPSTLIRPDGMIGPDDSTGPKVIPVASLGKVLKNLDDSGFVIEHVYDY